MDSFKPATTDEQDQLQEMANCIKCACGKRQRAEPQLPASECRVCVIQDELTGIRSKIIKQDFCCGVCRQVHPLARRVYV